MGPFKSHYHCVFPLAKMINENQSVIFVGSASVQEFVVNEGWEFHSIPLSFLNPQISLGRFFARVLDYMTSKIQIGFHYECREILRIIKGLKPEAIFIDAYMTRYYPLLKELNIKIVVIQPMLAANKKRNVPPINSGFVPSETFFSAFYVEILWKLFFINRAIIQCYFKFLSVGMNYASITKKLRHFDRSDFDFNTAGPPRLVYNDEIVLYSSAIEFPSIATPKHQLYFGLSIDLTRKEFISNEFATFVSDVKRKSLNKLIYCSFSTTIPKHHKHIRSFIQKLNEIAKRNPSWYFVVSNVLDVQLGGKSDKLLIVRYAPQIELLKVADIMITHGGLNSIQECIHFSVPMLVCPFISYTDHKGNAARVFFHKLGLLGNIKWNTVDDLEEKICHLLTNEKFRDNLNQLKKKIALLSEHERMKLWIKNLTTFQP